MTTEAVEPDTKRTVRIGTRASQLAMWQANWVKDQLEGRNEGLEALLIRIKTSGDKIRDVPLAQVGGKGLFVKEIEEALLDGRIDLAVHSMKDVPTEIPDGLQVNIITERKDPRDALVSGDGRKLADLPQGAVIGTSSLRRQAQLLNHRPDLVIEPLRGNVGTRLRKAEGPGLAGVILAAAGLKRLGFEDRISEYLSYDISLPAIGQGSLGIESRVGDEETAALLAPLNHPDSNVAVTAERAFLRRLEGGCQVPIAAFGQVEDGVLVMDGMIASLDGKRFLRLSRRGSTDDPETLGRGLAEELLAMGGGEILSEVYGTPLE